MWNEANNTTLVAQQSFTDMGKATLAQPCHIAGVQLLQAIRAQSAPPNASPTSLGLYGTLWQC